MIIMKNIISAVFDSVRSNYKSAIKAVYNFNSAQNDLLQSQNQSVPIPVSKIRWCLPSAESYKMNVNATCPSDDEKR